MWWGCNGLSHLEACLLSLSNSYTHIGVLLICAVELLRPAVVPLFFVLSSCHAQTRACHSASRLCKLQVLPRTTHTHLFCFCPLYSDRFPQLSSGACQTAPFIVHQTPAWLRGAFTDLHSLFSLSFLPYASNSSATSFFSSFLDHTRGL